MGMAMGNIRFWGCLTVFLLSTASGLSYAAKAHKTVPDAPKALTDDDIRWLDRITYGINTDSLQHLRQVGRKNFLEEQLRASDDALPQPVGDAIAHLDLINRPLWDILQDVEIENKRINKLPNDDEKQKARQQLNDLSQKTAYQAGKRHLLRALYSQSQLKEQMDWFWLNHFSVFQYKANLRWQVGDYEEQAIRPNALGKFRDLVLADLKHPAMLTYLDNAQSANGKINENYARELLELHTMGVNSGYTQQDVQELARILTGVGVNLQVDNPKLKPEWQPLYVRNGAFEFNPARHDFGDKSFLGHTIQGQGWSEVEQAVDLIVRQPATAKFICTKLATFFVGDSPSQAMVDNMASTFQRSDGRIADVLRTMLSSKEFEASLGSKFKDPMHYVVSVMRLAYDGKVVTNLKPVNGWLNALGEPLYGKLTPDGYGVRERDWASSGQMSKRFEIARAIGSGNAGLFDSEDGSPATHFGFPMLSNRLYYDTLEHKLASNVKTALDKATSQAEWNTLLLASPDFMYY